MSAIDFGPALFDKIYKLLNIPLEHHAITSGVSEARSAFDWHEPPGTDRPANVLAAARQQGLIGTKDRTIGGRVPSALAEAAKARSGIMSDSELLPYALSKVALEDDFGPKLLALKGSVPKNVALANGLVVLTRNVREFDVMNQVLPQRRVLFYERID